MASAPSSRASAAVRSRMTVSTSASGDGRGGGSGHRQWRAAGTSSATLARPGYPPLPVLAPESASSPQKERQGEPVAHRRGVPAQPAQAGGIAARTEPSAAGRPPELDGCREVGAAVRVLASSGGSDPQLDARGSSPAARPPQAARWAPRASGWLCSSRVRAQPPNPRPIHSPLCAQRGSRWYFSL